MASSKVVAPIPNIQDIDLRLLRVFIAVCRNGGFAAAQTELNIGQSTISGYISTLETRLGIVLCQRGRSGFRLTKGGESIFEASIELFHNLDNFRARVGEARNEITGRYSIGTVDAVTTLASGAIPGILREFAIEAPKVALDLRLGSPQALMRDLLGKRYDAIVLPVFRTPSGVKLISIEPEDPQSLYCGREHPLFNAEYTDQDIRKALFVHRSHMEGWSAYASNSLNIAATTVDVECQLMLVLTGRYISYLPDRYAEQWVQEGYLKRLDSPELNYTTNVCIAINNGDVSEATRILLTSAEKITGRSVVDT